MDNNIVNYMIELLKLEAPKNVSIEIETENKVISFSYADKENNDEE